MYERLFGHAGLLKPKATSQAIDEYGWMHTGDTAVMDEDGYVNIVGGLKIWSLEEKIFIQGKLKNI